MIPKLPRIQVLIPYGLALLLAAHLCCRTAYAQASDQTEIQNYTYVVDAPFNKHTSSSYATDLKPGLVPVDPFVIDIPRHDPKLGTLLRVYFAWHMEIVGTRTCSSSCQVAVGEMNFTADPLDTIYDGFVRCTDITPGSVWACGGVFFPYGLNFPYWPAGTSNFNDKWDSTSVYTFSAHDESRTFLTKADDLPSNWQLAVLPELKTVPLTGVITVNALARVTVTITYEYLKPVRVRVLDHAESFQAAAIAADGRANAVIEVASDSPGGFTVEPDMEANDNGCGYRPAGYGWALDGSITAPDEVSRKKTSRLVEPGIPIDTPRTSASGGTEYVGKAVYWAPSMFAESDCPDTSRTVPLKITAYNDSFVRVDEVRLKLKIVRPPVALVHGFNSDSSIFKALRARLQARAFHPDLVVDGDYKQTSCDGFSMNFRVPERAIENALDAAEQQKVEAEAVDFIAHSMGGLLTYAYASKWPVQYASPEGSHPIHSLVSLDTPWLGSAWPSNLTARVLISAMCKGKQGALNDLNIDSAPLWGILKNQPNVPVFAVAGVSSAWSSLKSAVNSAGDLVVVKASSLMAAVAAASAIVDSAPVPETANGDLVVSKCSQMGGVNKSPAFERDQTHMSAPGLLTGPYDHSQVIDYVMQRWSTGVDPATAASAMLDPLNGGGMRQCE
jgi:pimeloyl-ACP methyl ester carboxylesterase